MRSNQPAGDTRAVAVNSWVIGSAAALVALAAAIFLIHPPATHAAQAKGAVVETANTKLGRIVVNSNGRTLYLFGKDRNGKSACTGQCTSFWPPLLTSGKPRVMKGARASLIGTTKRSDGRLQVTYNHHPLYMFVKDKKAGQTNGEGRWGTRESNVDSGSRVEYPRSRYYGAAALRQTYSRAAIAVTGCIRSARRVGTIVAANPRSA